MAAEEENGGAGVQQRICRHFGKGLRCVQIVSHAADRP